MGCANVPQSPWPLSVTMSLLKPRSKKPLKPKSLNIEEVVAQHAIECAQELRASIEFDQGIPWVMILNRNMRRLALRLAKKGKP